MTDTSDIHRIPLAHSVRYVAHGLPEVPNQYGPGILAPSEITLTYRAAPDSQLGRVHAYVAGRIWVDGTELPLLPGGLYGQHYDDGLDGWSEWLAEEARLHDPECAASPGAPSIPSRSDTAAIVDPTALDVLRCLADPEPCRWEGVYCITHSWKSDVGRCPHGQAQVLLGGGR